MINVLYEADENNVTSTISLTGLLKEKQLKSVGAGMKKTLRIDEKCFLS